VCLSEAGNKFSQMKKYYRKSRNLENPITIKNNVEYLGWLDLA